MYAACAGELLEGTSREDEESTFKARSISNCPPTPTTYHTSRCTRAADVTDIRTSLKQAVYNQHLPHKERSTLPAPSQTLCLPNFAVTPSYPKPPQHARADLQPLHVLPHARNSSGRAPSPSPPPHTYSAMRVRP